MFNASITYKLLIGQALLGKWENFLTENSSCYGQWRYLGDDFESFASLGGWSDGLTGTALCPNWRACQCRAWSNTSDLTTFDPSKSLNGRVSRVSIWSRKLSNVELRLDASASTYREAIALNPHNLVVRWDVISHTIVSVSTTAPIVISTRPHMTIPLMREYYVEEGQDCDTVSQTYPCFSNENKSNGWSEKFDIASENCMAVGRAYCDAHATCKGFTSRWYPSLPNSNLTSTGFSYAAGADPTLRISALNVEYRDSNHDRTTLNVTVSYIISGHSHYAERFGVDLKCFLISESAISLEVYRMKINCVKCSDDYEFTLTSTHTLDGGHQENMSFDALFRN